jgi:S1-C subfamily serine protease
MSGGLAEQSNVIDLGDIILEVNNIPIHSAEDLSALVTYPCFFQDS